MVEVQDRTRESFRRLVHDGAEDLVLEALLRAYRSYETLRLDAAAGPWLKSILVKVFRSLYQTLVEQDPLPYSDTLHHDYLRAFGREDVREVLLRLPELYRAPLVLRYMDGFATKEIARLLEVPLGTVR